MTTEHRTEFAVREYVGDVWGSETVHGDDFQAALTELEQMRKCPNEKIEYKLIRRKVVETVLNH